MTIDKSWSETEQVDRRIEITDGSALQTQDGGVDMFADLERGIQVGEFVGMEASVQPSVSEMYTTSTQTKQYTQIKQAPSKRVSSTSATCSRRRARPRPI